MDLRGIQDVWRAGWGLATILLIAAPACGDRDLPETTAEQVAPLRQELDHSLGDGNAVRISSFAPMGTELLSGIQVASGADVDRIRFQFKSPGSSSTRWSDYVGGSGGTERPPFLLADGEKLYQVDVHCGTLLDSITFTTSLGNQYGPWGGSGGTGCLNHTYVTSFVGSERREIHGARVGWGGSGNVLNWISAIDYLPCQSCGSASEAAWSDLVWGGQTNGSVELSPQNDEYLSGIQVRDGTLIDAIGLRFTSKSSGITRWIWGGGTGGTLETAFLLNPGEFLKRIEGRSGNQLDAIKFVTSSGRTYPTSSSGRSLFGGTGGFPFEYETRVHGGLRRRINGLDIATISGKVGRLFVFEDYSDTYGGLCSHLACAQGVAMSSTCDPCVATICAQDPFCCTNSWDSTCVSEVSSFCGLPCS